MNKILASCAICALLIANPLFAEDKPLESVSPKLEAQQATVVDEQQTANVTAALEKLSKITGTPFTASNIKTTPIPGILEVTSDATVFYISTDGKYIIAGELLDVDMDLQNWSLTEKAMRNLRVQLLSQVSEKDMIIFPARQPKIGTVTVFTDIDCGYCRKMQAHMKEYNDLGIEVRYLAFPRTGPGSPSFDKAVSVWCADDKQMAISLAKQGKEVPNNQCANNPVVMQYELGRKLGIGGTPTLIFNNGSKVPGFLEPEALRDVILEETNL